MPVDLFLTIAIQSLYDMKNLVGFIVAGILIRNPAIAAFAGAAWAVGVVFYDSNMGVTPTGLAIFARITAGAAVTVVACIAGGFLLRRRHR